MRRRDAWVRGFLVLAIGFCLGAITDWWVTPRAGPEERAGVQEPPMAVASAPAAQRQLGTSGRTPSHPTVREVPWVVAELRSKSLRVPLDGADVASWKGSFEEGRTGHQHEAVDILAPRGTPVHAVDDGVVAKLFKSAAGGITLYQFDPSRRFTYYYAHLDGYADGVTEGGAITRGQVIGYVGTTGNAPRNTPHLHFAIFQLAQGEGWWQGRAVDPYLAYRGDE